MEAFQGIFAPAKRAVVTALQTPPNRPSEMRGPAFATQWLQGTSTAGGCTGHGASQGRDRPTLLTEVAETSGRCCCLVRPPCQGWPRTGGREPAPMQRFHQGSRVPMCFLMSQMETRAQQSPEHRGLAARRSRTPRKVEKHTDTAECHFWMGPSVPRLGSFQVLKAQKC